jgi:hypothetical protein
MNLKELMKLAGDLDNKGKQELIFFAVTNQGYDCSYTCD